MKVHYKSISRSNGQSMGPGWAMASSSQFGLWEGTDPEWRVKAVFIASYMQMRDSSCTATMRLNLRPSALIGCPSLEILAIQPMGSDMDWHCTVRTRPKNHSIWSSTIIGSPLSQSHTSIPFLILCKWRLQAAQSRSGVSARSYRLCSVNPPSTMQCESTLNLSSAKWDSTCKGIFFKTTGRIFTK